VNRILLRSPLAIAGLAVLALAGCGSPAAGSQRSAGAILDAANQQALGASFQMSFSSQLHVGLTGVTGLSGTLGRELSIAQTEINAAEFRGVVEFQSKTQFELTFTLSPLLDQPWHLIDLDGTEYISENGTQWYTVSGNSGVAGDVGGAAGGGLGDLKAQLQTWGQELRGSATVSNLGDSELDGAKVDHVQTSVSGAALNKTLAQAFAGVATKLGTAAPSLSGDIPALEQLLQFNSIRVDSYVLTSNGRLARTDIAVGLTLDLSALSTLAPGQAGLPGGSVAITFNTTANFSDFGKDFGIGKPSDIVAGPVPTPSGLGGIVNPT